MKCQRIQNTKYLKFKHICKDFKKNKRIKNQEGKLNLGFILLFFPHYTLMFWDGGERCITCSMQSDSPVAKQVSAGEFAGRIQ